MSKRIKGFCPMGCGETLAVWNDGVIGCSSVACPAPATVAELLADAETQHIVLFTATGFTIKHPLRERINDSLLRCGLHSFLAAQDAHPQVQGCYRAGPSANGWAFERIGS